MPEPKEESGAQKMIGAFAPKLVELTDDVLFGDVWAREALAPRDRSLITVAALIAGSNTEQLPYHLNKASTTVGDSAYRPTSACNDNTGQWSGEPDATKTLTARAPGPRPRATPAGLTTDALRPHSRAQEPARLLECFQGVTRGHTPPFFRRGRRLVLEKGQNRLCP